MAGLREVVEREILAWPGVEARPHRFGGIEFRVAGHEIGHLHGERMADLPFPVKVREELVAEGRAQPHHLLPRTGWVSFYPRGMEDAGALVELFRRNYGILTERAQRREASGRSDGEG
jgi:hypothetical protein